ncbi:STAS domain-containing protein [Micromonospora sp. NPDC051196]|uniref:STAS domain-containing protein n=1 Tax=Micromonospora sp. NPDC051196 TaxID=3155281 RepID=UPI00343B921D
MTAPRRPECTVPLVEVAITEFDLACLPETGAVFDRLLTLHPKQVMIDLSGCRHIDAAGIGLLLDVHRRMVRTGGVLSVRNPNPRIARILQTARLDQILPVHTDGGAVSAVTTDPGAASTDAAVGATGHPTAYGRAAVPVRT